MYAHGREVERQTADVGQRYVERLAQDVVAAVGEEVADEVRLAADDSREPGEEGIKDAPDEEGPEHAADALAVERAGRLADGQQQGSGNHDEQRDAGPKQGSVDGAPELEFLGAARDLWRNKVESVGAVAAHYGKEGDQTNGVEPYDALG